jgi:hypothetical protein
MTVPYSAKEKKQQRERVKHWLLKDKNLTNRQICELTGVNERIISKVRRELSIPSIPEIPMHKAVDAAFKKFMEQQGKPVQKKSIEFNPWLRIPKGKNDETNTSE